MSLFLDVPSAVIHVGAHRLLLCSELQFRTWHEMLVGGTENVVKEKNVVIGEEARS